jgi:hypothetical protein
MAQVLAGAGIVWTAARCKARDAAGASGVASRCLSGQPSHHTVVPPSKRSSALAKSGLSRLTVLGLLCTTLVPAAGFAGSQSYAMTFSSPEGGRYCGTGSFVLASPPAPSGMQVFSNDGHPGDGVLHSLSFDVGGIKAAAKGTFTVTFDGPALTGVHFFSDPLSGRHLETSGTDLSYEVDNRLNEELAAGTIQVTALAAPPVTAAITGNAQSAAR